MSESALEQNLLAAIKAELLDTGRVEPGTEVTVTAVNETIQVNLDGVQLIV